MSAVDRLMLLLRRWWYAARTCESCGAPADAILRDGSTWCGPCHRSALNLGYDNDFGKAIR